MTNNDQRISSLQSEATELRREVSLFDGVNVLAGIMIGSGIFYLGSYVLIRSGMSLGLALLVWVIGGIVTLLSGLCYAELGAMMPKAGGSYVYLREAFGERVAFMSGLSGFIIGSCGSTAGLAIAFPSVISNIYPLSDLQIKGIAVILIILLTGVNILGIKQGTIVQNIFTIGKIIPIAVILIAGLLMGTQSPDLSLTPASAPSIGKLIGMIGFAVVATLWAYEGWTNLNVISEEIKDPKKNIPLAIIISIVAVMGLYTAFNYSIYKVLPIETIQSLISSENYFLGTEVAKTLFGGAGALIVGVGMAVSVFGALNGCVMVFPRSCYAMARDGLLPKQFASVHPKYKTPAGALMIHMIISILLVGMRDLNQITSLVVFSGFIFNALTFYSVIVLRKKYPEMNRPYKVWGYPTIVYITIAIMIGLLLNTLFEDPTTSIIGLAVPAASLVLYQFIKTKKAN